MHHPGATQPGDKGGAIGIEKRLALAERGIECALADSPAEQLQQQSAQPLAVDRVIHCRRQTATKDAGFTLLELLVAVAVFGVVLVLLTQGVQFGVHATRLQAEAQDRNGDLAAVDHALRRMVTLADPGAYPEPATLRGTARSLSLTTELPLHADGQTQRVDATLSAEAGRLLLRWTPHRHAELYGAKPKVQETVMLDGVERLELAYWTAGAWVAVWNGDKLPALVRIHIMFSGGTGRHWPPLLVEPIREGLEE